MKKSLVKVGGVILAAGLSRRFGGQKLLVPWGGGPLGRRCVEAALASRLRRVVLVTRAESVSALSVASPKLKVILNHRPETGQALSLKLGLAALEPSLSHALFLLADQPLVDAGLIDRFVRAAEEGAALAAVRQGDAFGPPTLFGRAHFEELESLEGDEGGRRLLTEYEDQVVAVEPERPHQAWDVDRPEDFEALRMREEEDAS